jgi:hypothetical protein
MVNHRGGARVGAGRKAKPGRVKYTFALRAKTLSQLNAAVPVGRRCEFIEAAVLASLAEKRRL